MFDFNEDREKIFIILGTFETNPNENKISNKSPLGKALLGKELNDEFEFRINENILEYEILKIEQYKMDK